MLKQQSVKKNKKIKKKTTDVRALAILRQARHHTKIQLVLVEVENQFLNKYNFNIPITV